MSSASDDFTILMNIVGRVGMEGDVMGEFAKAKSMLNKYDSQMKAQAMQQQMQQQPQMPMTQMPQAPVPQPNGMGQGELNMPPTM